MHSFYCGNETIQNKSAISKLLAFKPLVMMSRVFAFPRPRYFYIPHSLSTNLLDASTPPLYPRPPSVGVEFGNVLFGFDANSKVPVSKRQSVGEQIELNACSKIIVNSKRLIIIFLFINIIFKYHDFIIEVSNIISFEYTFKVSSKTKTKRFYGLIM